MRARDSRATETRSSSVDGFSRPSVLAVLRLGLLMTLSLPERLAMLMPPSVFYRRRIAQEARTGEPELAVLAELVPRGGIAVDVGANVGFFAYALANVADRVLAFEP